MKLVHWINLLLLAALIGFAAVTWAERPERIPVHFGLDGRPTRWSGPSFLAWFGLPIITVLLVAFIYAVARLLSRHPHLINMPDKARFLALPASRRAAVIERVQDFMFWVTAPTVMIAGSVQWAMNRGTLAGATGAEIVLVVVMSSLVGPVLMIVWSRRVKPELDRQIREHQKAG